MWYYNNQPISNIEQLNEHESLMGFVYMIRNNVSGQIYIGRKNFYSTRKTATPKRDQVMTKKGTVNKRSLTKKVTKESDWMKYYSSCSELKNDLKTLGVESFDRFILDISCSIKMLGFLELKYQFAYNVLEVPSYNDNIMGRYYRKDMKPCEISNLISDESKKSTQVPDNI